MATFDHHGPDRNEIREAYNKAAAKGDRFLAIIDQVLEDEYAVNVFTFTASVKKACDIVFLIEQKDKDSGYARHRLSHALDVRQDFDTQMEKWGKGYDGILPPFVQNEITNHEQRQDLARRQAAFKQKPFLTRLFSTPPTK